MADEVTTISLRYHAKDGKWLALVEPPTGDSDRPYRTTPGRCYEEGCNVDYGVDCPHLRPVCYRWPRECPHKSDLGCFNASKGVSMRPGP